MKALLFITLLICSFGKLFSQESQADDSILLPKVLQQLGLKNEDINTQLYAEKVLPNAKTQAAVVVAKYRKNEPDGYGNFYSEYDVYVLIVNNTTGKILYKYFEEEALISDAIRLTSINVDTGIFTLNSETRAFGIEAYYSGSSQPNPHHHTDLSLFIKNNKSLKKVLNNFTTQKFGGEWDMKCVGEFEEVNSTIIIDNKNKSKNFNGLIVKDKVTKTIGKVVNDECEEKESVSIKTRKLKYNGMEYK